MVIAWDRRSGVSRSIPRWFHPTPGSDPIRAGRPSCGGYAILEAGLRARQAGTFAAGCQRQLKCDPLAAKCQRLAGLQPLSRRRASVDPEADALTARARRAMRGDVVPKLFGHRDLRSLSSCARARAGKASPTPAWRDSVGPPPGPLAGHYARRMPVIQGQLTSGSQKTHCQPAGAADRDLPSWSCEFDSRHPLSSIAPSQLSFAMPKLFEHSDDKNSQAGHLYSMIIGVRATKVACQEGLQRHRNGRGRS